MQRPSKYDNISFVDKTRKYSSLAQSVEHSAVNRSVVGSSPTGGVFYGNVRLHGQAVKTPPFHGGNRGSNPLGVTEKIK